MPSKISKRTLQGLKNAGTLADWKLLHGNKLVRVYSKEWGSWWKANGCGYTVSLADAGIYTFKEALAYSGHCGPEKKIEYHFMEPLYAKSSSQVIGFREALGELVAAIKAGRYEDPAHDRIYSAIMQAEKLLEGMKDAKSR